MFSSCIRDLDSRYVGMSKKSCGAEPQEGWRHMIRKFRRVIGVKLSLEDRNKWNTVDEIKR